MMKIKIETIVYTNIDSTTEKFNVNAVCCWTLR